MNLIRRVSWNIQGTPNRYYLLDHMAEYRPIAVTRPLKSSRLFRL